MGRRNPRAPGLGDEAFPIDDLQRPEVTIDRDYAGFSIDEARKAKYHGLDITDFEDLDTIENRRLIDRYTPLYIGQLLLEPPADNPATFYYKKKPDAKTLRPVLLSSTEALFLGRDPAVFGADAAAKARQRIREMRHPDFETIPDPPERWRILQTYTDESIRWQRTVNKRLYDASRFRNSNGEVAEKYDRLNFVKFMRTTVIHRTLEDLPPLEGWDGVELPKLHRIVDWRLFFEGTTAGRRKEWQEWHWIFSELLECKHGLFDQAIEKAKHRPDEPMRIGNLAVTGALRAVQ